jgi:diguanylate cyclase (GGDEF)-like protein
MPGTFPDLATVSLVAAVLLGMLAASLFHVAAHAPSPQAVRLWGQSCLVAALGFTLRSLEPAASPGALAAFGDLLLGASIILQGAAFAPYSRYGGRLVRALVIFNAVHLLSTIHFAGLDPNPVLRVICADLIGAAALFTAAGGIWRPTRREFGQLGRIVAATYAVTGVALLADGVATWQLGAPQAAEFLGWTALIAAVLQVMLPLALLAVTFGQLAAQLARSALLDPLTQARNRRGLAESWGLLQARARRGDEGWHVGVVLLDIDYFKKVNQAHGHATGDMVLQLVVEAMRATARRYDTVGRFGGEEFCMLLPGVTIRQAQVVTERVRRRFTELARERTGLEITISAGITVANAGQTAMEQALDAADQMLYVAKHEGRDRSRVDPDALRVISGMAPLQRTGRQDELGFPLV